MAFNFVMVVVNSVGAVFVAHAGMPENAIFGVAGAWVAVAGLCNKAYRREAGQS